MTVLLSILAILFLVLVVGIPLIEKYSTEKSEEELARSEERRVGKEVRRREAQSR